MPLTLYATLRDRRVALVPCTTNARKNECVTAQSVMYERAERGVSPIICQWNGCTRKEETEAEQRARK